MSRFPRLFSNPRAYDPGESDADHFIALDDTDFGADRFYDKRNGNVSEPGERHGRAHLHRAQQELRRKTFDFSQLLKHWKG